MKTILVDGLEQECSQLVMGTSWFRLARQPAVFDVIDSYVAHGGNTFDTSLVYGSGEAERVFSSWLKTQTRQDMLIISKACHHPVDINDRHYPEQKRVRPECITEDLERSLANLQVDYFDMLLLHRDDPAIPVCELLDRLEEQKQQGLIRAYGVSNWSLQRLDQATAYASKNGLSGIALNSPSLSLAKAVEPRWAGTVYADRDYIQWHERTQLPLFSWAAQASGFFHFAAQCTREDFPNRDIARTYYSDGNIERLKRLQQLAKDRGDGSDVMSLALAYVLQQPYPTCAVIGPQTTAEVLSSIKATKIKLSRQECSWLDLQT